MDIEIIAQAIFLILAVVSFYCGTVFTIKSIIITRKYLPEIHRKLTGEVLCRGYFPRLWILMDYGNDVFFDLQKKLQDKNSPYHKLTALEIQKLNSYTKYVVVAGALGLLAFLIKCIFKLH